jgi:hypothetical protein
MRLLIRVLLAVLASVRAVENDRQNSETSSIALQAKGDSAGEGVRARFRPIKNRTVLGVQRTRFALNGKPKFLVWNQLLWWPGSAGGLSPARPR